MQTGLRAPQLVFPWQYWSVASSWTKTWSVVFEPMLRHLLCVRLQGLLVPGRASVSYVSCTAIMRCKPFFSRSRFEIISKRSMMVYGLTITTTICSAAWLLLLELSQGVGHSWRTPAMQRTQLGWKSPAVSKPSTLTASLVALVTGMVDEFYGLIASLDFP